MSDRISSHQKDNHLRACSIGIIARMRIQLKCRINDMAFFFIRKIAGKLRYPSQIFLGKRSAVFACNSLHNVETIALPVKTLANCMQCFMRFSLPDIHFIKNS